MATVAEVCEILEALAPLSLAEDWDNVGLLVGDPSAQVQKVMTCLTITPDSAAEAVDAGADLIVTHHPMPFRPLKRITTETTPGRLLWQLIGSGVAVYSSHTAFDSTAEGINEQLAAALDLHEVSPLVPAVDDPTVGAGRYGRLEVPESLRSVAARLAAFTGQMTLRGVAADRDAPVERIAVACGSAGEFLADAQKHVCQVLVTGETSFHTCLEAEATGINLLLLGHFASERFAVVALAERLKQDLTNVETVWASETEHDPICIF